MGGARRKPWNFPDCPSCETPVLVRYTNSSRGRWVCEACATYFS